MKINIDIKLVIIFILVFILIFGGCWSKRKYDAQYSKIDSLTLANQNTQILYNKANQIINQQKILLTDNQSVIKHLSDSIFNLKKENQKKINEVIAYYSEKTKIKIDTFYIPYTISDTVYTNTGFIIGDSTYLKVPKSVKYSNSWIKLDATIGYSGFRLNSFSMTDSQYIRVIELKHGLFKPKSLEIQSLHTNPYLSIEGQNSIIYKPKKKNDWLIKGILFAGGLFLGTRL